jgi:cob(I)alamin adenosyltransferase
MAQPPDWTRGRVHVYTGDGKGKTTAALGLALRAAGAGLKVLFAQFIKAGDYSEIVALRRFPGEIEVRQYGRGHFIRGVPSDEDRASAAKGLAEIEQELASGGYRVAILDEANDAVDVGLFAVADLLRVVEGAPDDVEMVLTGRNAHPSLLERADLVTDMRAVKHYFDQGVPARRGIES